MIRVARSWTLLHPVTCARDFLLLEREAQREEVVVLLHRPVQDAKGKEEQGGVEPLQRL